MKQRTRGERVFCLFRFKCKMKVVITKIKHTNIWHVRIRFHLHKTQLVALELMPIGNLNEIRRPSKIQEKRCNKIKIRQITPWISKTQVYRIIQQFINIKTDNEYMNDMSCQHISADYWLTTKHPPAVASTYWL